jgi:hypothetical protein
MTKTQTKHEKIPEIQNTAVVAPEERTSAAPSESAAVDGSEFDLAKLRLSQNYAEQVGVKKLLINVPVQKPNRQWFIRVHPEESWRLATAVFEWKEDRQTYLVDPPIWGELPGDLVPKTLYTAVNRQGGVFLWPIPLPREDGRDNAWSRSAREAAEIATGKWIRVAANMSQGAYDVFEAIGNFPEPEWPNLTFEELVHKAFKGRYIDSPDHPALRQLRGEQ